MNNPTDEDIDMSDIPEEVDAAFLKGATLTLPGEDLIDKPKQETDRFLEASIIAELEETPNGVEERDYDIVFAFDPYSVIAIKAAIRKLIRLGIVRITDGRAFLVPSSEWPKIP